MNCIECLSLIDDYVENSLDSSTAARATAHLSDCVKCGVTYEELKNEQALYSRYLLKIRESPESWDVVRTEIRKGGGAVSANPETIGAGFYKGFTTAFFRRPLFSAVAVLVVLIGLSLIWLFKTNIFKDVNGTALISSSSDQLSSNQTENDGKLTDGAKMEDLVVKSAKDETETRKDGKRLIDSNKLTYSVRIRGERTQAKSVIAYTAAKVPEDSSEVAFNRHIDQCLMVLRLFRNAIRKTDDSGFDISYEKRLSKGLLNTNARFRREAQRQVNLPVEQLLVGLEAILGDIVKLSEKATSADVNLIKGRIQESGIIAKLQIQSSATWTSD